MKKYHYPEFEEHKASHQKLIGQVSDFVSKLDNGEDIAEDLLNFLNQWISKHIMGADKKYAPFLNEQGVV